MIDIDVWNRIVTAYQMVFTGQCSKVEGNGWLVYRVGTIVRIDIKER